MSQSCESVGTPCHTGQLTDSGKSVMRIGGNTGQLTGDSGESVMRIDGNCCSSTGCIGYIRLFSAADTILLLHTLLCLSQTYCMLLVHMTDQWAV